MERFNKRTSAFNYVYEKEMESGETVILQMPEVSPNKKGINDIGWQTDGTIAIYGTLSENPDSENALWQEIYEGEEINKTVSALKIINYGTTCKVIVRVILC